MVILSTSDVTSQPDLWSSSDLKWIQCVLPKNPKNLKNTQGFLKERDNIRTLTEQVVQFTI